MKTRFFNILIKMDIYSFVLSFILLNSSVLTRASPCSSVAKIRIDAGVGRGLQKPVVSDKMYP
jgi:hypothetical protein